MNPNLFLNYTVPDRIRILLTDGDREYIYYLLSVKLKSEVNKLKERYDIKVNKVRQYFDISGNTENIAIFFYFIQSYGVKPDSITATNLRILIPNFLTKIK